LLHIFSHFHILKPSNSCKFPTEHIMSSDDEGVRRPGRAGNGPESPAHSNANDSGAENHAGGNAMDEDDDADLFGSDGEGGLDDIKYAYQTNTECAEY
jgi:hypothetical protein